MTGTLRKNGNGEAVSKLEWEAKAKQLEARKPRGKTGGVE